MKYVLGIMMLVMSMSAFGFKYGGNDSHVRVEEVCKAGHVFVVVWSATHKATPNIVQVMNSVKGSDRPQPMRCDK